MAVPETQDLDDAVRLLHEIEDAIGAFEDGQFLRLRVGGVEQETPGVCGAGIGQPADRFRREVVGVLLATLGLAAFRPLGDDFLDIGPRALRQDYAEALRGHRCCTFPMNSSAP